MVFPLAHLYLTLADSKDQGQGQGHANFECEFLANAERYGKYLQRSMR